jgi:nicotinamidase-related amidase
MADAHERDTVIANIAALVDKARAQNAPVIWVQHSDTDLQKGSDAWRYVPELEPHEDEPLVHKSYGDAFEDTTLDRALTDARIGHLVVAGAETDVCIRSTIHGAFTRGYDVTLVQDAHTTPDKSEWGAPPPEQVIAHTNLYWRSLHAAPGRTATVTDTRNVTFNA